MRLGTVQVNGKSFATVTATATSITAKGYLPPWTVGNVTVSVAQISTASGAAVSLSVPVVATAATYDTAARFATQAAWGPRPDIVEHIQQVGLSAFIDEQLQVPPPVYDLTRQSRTQFITNAVVGNALLRMRAAWAFESFIPQRANAVTTSGLGWENTLEADAFSNFRKILADVASDPNVTGYLNLPGNWAPTDPGLHPNQNFARELMQVFSLGTVMLNDDGTVQTDAAGTPIPSYEQDTVGEVSRALTGWDYATPQNAAFTSFGVDYSLPLAAHDDRHDHGSKTIFGTIVIPAGQTIAQDRDAVLDAIFQHQSCPPYVSRILIQRFVKSQPTPSYVARISAVFKDDGHHVRGNLAAVIRAILLDPEARAGDTNPRPDDGFLQDPWMGQIFFFSALHIAYFDDQPSYTADLLGQHVWCPPSVFSYYSPSYTIPGTTINSPEFQIYNPVSLVQRSGIYWKYINEPLWNYSRENPNWLFGHFQTVPDLLDALDHLAYHGRMPATLKQQIAAYSASMPDPWQQLNTAAFLAFNSDSYTVVQ